MQSTEHEQDEALDTWMIEVDGVMVPDYDRTLTNFNEGDVVSGTVVRVDKDEILVDIGYKSEGVIPVAELSIRRSVNGAHSARNVSSTFIGRRPPRARARPRCPPAP